MKRRINPFVVIYLLIVFLPLAIIATALTAIITIIMSTLLAITNGVTTLLWSGRESFVDSA